MSIWLSSAQPSSELVGKIIGVSIIPLLLLLGFIKCVKIAKRPATNGICVMALGMVLLGLLTMVAVSLIAEWQPEISKEASLVAVVLMLLCSMSALLLCVVGLATHDPKLHVQGRAQAFWSLGLGLIFTGISSFGLIVRVAQQEPAQVAALTNVERPGWGYSTHLPESEWKNWPDNGTVLADFAALRADEGLLVVPVDLKQKAPDLEIVASGLLGRISIAYPSDEGWVSKPWQNSWGAGLEITGTRAVDGTDFDYILHLAVKDTLAQLHVGWATKNKGDLARVRAALDSIKLSVPQPPPPVLPPAKAHEFALLCNKIGIALYQQEQFQDSVPWFTRAFEQTSKDATLLANVADAFKRADMAKEGLAYLAPRMGAFAKSAPLHLHHAYLLSGTGEHAAGEKAFVQALGTGLKDEDTVLAWLQHLNEKEQYALAEEASEAWMKKHPDVNSRRWHAQTVITAGDEKRGLQLFEELSKEFPDDRRASYDWGEALNSAGEHAQAAAIAEKILSDGKNANRALMMLGWSQMGRKWYREAKETFEKVSSRLPDDETVQDAHRRASAMLGQGNNSDIKTPVQAVALPEKIQVAIRNHAPEKDYGSSRPYSFLLAAKGYFFEPGKPSRRTVHRRMRVNTKEGANALSSLDQTFDPLGERIFINRVSVTDENGVVLASAPGDAYVVDLDDGNGSHRKKLHFQIPGLRPGCIVEYEVSIEDRGPASTFSFERYQFGDCAADIVFVTGAVKEVQVATARAEVLQTIQEEGLLAWMGFNLPYDLEEAMSGRYEDRVPSLWLGGKNGTWEEVGKSFSKDLEGLLQQAPEAAVLATKLTANLKTPREKIAALTEHVQKHVSYTAIEFGTRARRPNPASQTLTQQYGDCKDQALLLHQLLKGVGIESHLALVNTLWRVQPEQPDLDQFNHMVLHVPTLGEDWLIDPTDKHLPGHLFPADSLWHSHALLLVPGKPRLIPPNVGPKPASCLVTSQRTVRPKGDRWHVDETLILNGYYASWMRSAFAGLDAPAQLRKTQALMEKYAPVRVDRFEFEGQADTALPARLLITYSVLGRLHAEDGGSMRATLPALWENDYMATTFIKERQTPFLVRYPFGFRSEVKVTGIPHLSEASIKALSGSTVGTFTRWKLDSSASGDSATMRFEFDSFAGEHPAAGYSTWQDEWHSALKCWDHPLVWKP